MNAPPFQYPLGYGQGGSFQKEAETQEKCWAKGQDFVVERALVGVVAFLGRLDNRISYTMIRISKLAQIDRAALETESEV